MLSNFSLYLNILGFEYYVANPKTRKIFSPIPSYLDTQSKHIFLFKNQ